MGTLRVYLALCVMVAHGGRVLPWGMHSGVEAVQVFFLISGFYMALAFPKYSSIKDFILSRFIRIFVPYWFLLICITLLSLFSGIVFGHWLELDPYIMASDNNGLVGVILTIFSNIFIFGQDIVMFLSHDLGGDLHFTSNFAESANPLYKYLIMPTAWSLPLELCFYLLTPFLVAWSNFRLITIALVITLVRHLTYNSGYSSDPWTYRFLPFELSLFILGILSYRFGVNFHAYFNKAAKVLRKFLFNYVLRAIFFMALFYCLYQIRLLCSYYISENKSLLITYLLWGFLIPLIFQLTKESKKDRKIGELSFPIYLIHVFILSVFSLWKTEFYLKGLVELITVILLSFLVVVLIVKPSDKLRYTLVGLKK